MLPSILLHPWFNYTSASAYIVPATLALYKGPLIFGEQLQTENRMTKQSRISFFIIVFGELILSNIANYQYVFFNKQPVRRPLMALVRIVFRMT